MNEQVNSFVPEKAGEQRYLFFIAESFKRFD